eukprot:scaffold265_cov131-Cylindrotheca_fusiformis.AAC.13
MANHSSKCALCSKPGPVQKLFKKCKHDSACFDCLRNRYIHQAQDAFSYPLKCFHPHCRRTLRNTQVEQLCKTPQELERFYHLSRINKTMVGDEWTECIAIMEALGCEMCRCPRCGFIITKKGGCDHMMCVCGEEFLFKEAASELKEMIKYRIPSCRPVQVHAPKKELAPRLLLDDEYHLEDDCSSYEIENSCSDHQEEDSVLDSIESVPTNAPTLSMDATDDDMESHTSSVIPSSIDTWYGIREDDWDQDFELLDTMDSADRDDPAAAEVENRSVESSSTWEEVSEISSVVSLNSKSGLSFAEAVRLSGGATKAPSPKTAIELLPMIREQPTRSTRSEDGQINDDEDSGLDFYSMYEGFKGSRGGKAKFRFHHQPKRKNRKMPKNKR